jgi:hypothetical protein
MCFILVKVCLIPRGNVIGFQLLKRYTSHNCKLPKLLEAYEIVSPEAYSNLRASREVVLMAGMPANASPMLVLL